MVSWTVRGGVCVTVGDVIMTSTGRRGRIVKTHSDGRPVIVLESGPVAGAELAIWPDTIDRKVN